MEQLATINCVYDVILYLHMHCRQCNDACIQQVIKNNRSPCPFFRKRYVEHTHHCQKVQLIFSTFILLLINSLL